MKKSEKTKQFIVEKTAPIFNKKGYAGTSLSDLTEATGLTKGSIYGNFANKDDVALAAFDHNLAQLNYGMNATINDVANAIEKLMLMARYYRNEYPNVLANGGCPILNTATDADDTHPLLQSKASKALHSWKQLIIDIVTNGKAHAEIRPGVHASDFATVFIALVEGGIMLAKVTGDHHMLITSIARIESIIQSELVP